MLPGAASGMTLARAPLASLGAAGLAWQLAYEVEQALFHGMHVSGLAVDWKKAYDSVVLAKLRTALETAGWPREIREPMLCAYSAPRRVREAGLLGPLWEPVAGIPAGCPLAVHALAVFLQPWAARARLQDESALLRLYVDDTTAMAFARAMRTAIDRACALGEVALAFSRAAPSTTRGSR